MDDGCDGGSDELCVVDCLRSTAESAGSRDEWGNALDVAVGGLLLVVELRWNG